MIRSQDHGDPPEISFLFREKEIPALSMIRFRVTSDAESSAEGNRNRAARLTLLQSRDS